MNIIVKKTFPIVQYIILHISYYLCKPFTRRSESWVIGARDVASFIHLVGGILKPSFTVNTIKSPLYNYNYNYSLNVRNRKLEYLIGYFYFPLLLGYLTNKSTHFFYVFSYGFLINRDYELKFLKSKGKKIVCLFIGSDIRSNKLMIDYVKSIGFDNGENYVCTTKSEAILQQTAKSADKYADLIFSHKIDQISYLKSKQHPWVYSYPENKFNRNDKKFEDISNIKILHAPTNPIWKGTPLVRSAIKKLEVEGYNFEYIELTKVSNSQVIEQLKSTHIVLNQFYAFASGLFGIEAMANHCALLQSADPKIDKDLPEESEDAWLVTRYWEIYDNLKLLLDNPDKIKSYADRGYNFAWKNYRSEVAKKYLLKVLSENNIINASKE